MKGSAAGHRSFTGLPRPAFRFIYNKNNIIIDVAVVNESETPGRDLIFRLIKLHDDESH